jgi:excisionase family DNA binding protein
MHKKRQFQNNLISAVEIADRIGIGISTARKMLKSGKWGPPICLASIGSRRHFRVKRSEFDTWMSSLDARPDVNAI